MTAVATVDLNSDDNVDLGDMVILGQSWMLSDSDSGFCRLGDFNDDKVINNSDIDTLADYFGVSCDFTGNCNTGQIKQYYYHFDQPGRPQDYYQYQKPLLVSAVLVRDAHLI